MVCVVFETRTISTIRCSNSHHIHRIFAVHVKCLYNHKHITVLRDHPFFRNAKNIQKLCYLANPPISWRQQAFLFQNTYRAKPKYSMWGMENVFFLLFTIDGDPYAITVNICKILMQDILWKSTYQKSQSTPSKRELPNLYLWNLTLTVDTCRCSDWLSKANLLQTRDILYIFAKNDTFYILTDREFLVFVCICYWADEVSHRKFALIYHQKPNVLFDTPLNIMF